MKSSYFKSLNLLFTMALIGIHVSAEDQTEKPPIDAQIPIELCQTTACQQAADQILKTIDETTDPCENFYQFTCGKSINSTENPTKEDYGLYNEAYFHAKKQLDSLLNAPADPNEWDTSKKVKSFYKRCSDFVSQDEISKLGHIFNFTGGFPIFTPDWKEDDFDLIKVSKILKEFGFLGEFPVELSLEVDEDTSDLKSITILLQLVFFKWNQLSKLSKDEENDVFNQLKQLMINTSDGAAAAEFKILFKNALMIKENVEKSDLSKNTNSIRNYTLVQLEQDHPSLPWKELIRSQLNQITDEELDEVVIKSNYLGFDDEVKDLLKSKKLWSDLLHLEISLIFTNELSKRLPLLKITPSIYINYDREGCIDLAKHKLSSAVIPMYVKKYGLAESREHAMKIFDNVKAQYIKELKKAQYAGDLIEAIENHWQEKLILAIGYHDMMLNESAIDLELTKVDLDNSNFLQSLQSVLAYPAEWPFTDGKSLFDNFDDKLLYFTVIQMSSRSFYLVAYSRSISGQSAIYMTLPYLELPFFSPGFPDSVNYGRLGSIFGHELNHILLLGPQRQAEFFENECLVEHYSKYVLENGEHVNGNRTYPENVADVAGIRVAYNALFEASNVSTDTRLVQLDRFSSRQLFWISMVKLGCGRPARSATYHPSTDAYPPAEVRYNEALSNLEEFSRDFGCPKGLSKLNPVEKCPAI